MKASRGEKGYFGQVEDLDGQRFPLLDMAKNCWILYPRNFSDF
jgi:hypothetical protein